MTYIRHVSETVMVWGAGQSITSAIYVPVQFPNEEVDPFNNWDTSLHQYTVKQGGKYLITCSLTFASSSWNNGSNCELYLYKNGTLERVIGSFVLQTRTTLLLQVRGTCIFTGAENDVIQLYVRHTGGTGKALYTGADASARTYLHVARLEDA